MNVIALVNVNIILSENVFLTVYMILGHNVT